MANLPTTNNDPGDLKDPSTGTFQQFADPKEGFAALLNDLQTKINNHPNWTLGDFAKVYAPPSDNNDTGSYIAKLANQLKVRPDATIGSLKSRLGDFASAVASNEGYQGSSGAFVNPNAPQTGGANFVTPPPPPAPTTAAPTSPAPSSPGLIQSLVQGIANPFLQGARIPIGLAEQGIGALTGNAGLQGAGQITAGNQPLNLGYFGNVNQVGFDQNGRPLGFGGSLAQAAGAGMQIAPWFVGGGAAENAIGKIGEQTLPGLMKLGAATGAAIGGIGSAGQALQSGTEQNQPGANIAANAIGQGAIGAATGAGLGALAGGATGLIGKLAGKLNINKAVDDTVESVSSNLTGKGLSKAYGKAALEGGITKPGVFTKGAVGASADEVRLGTSLAKSGVVLKPNDPMGNLITIGKEMDATEAKIKPFNDIPVTGGVKRVLNTELDGIKNKIPTEYQGIKEQQGIFDKAVDYAKSQVLKYKDTIGGYREGRTQFDSQFLKEFPSAALPKGGVNINTPAGRAWQAVRNVLNDNLYTIAPTNANLQGLIGHEADLFKAIDRIAPKAAKLTGKTLPQLFLSRHPFIRTAWNLGKYAVPAGLIGGGLVAGAEHVMNP